MLLSSAFAQDAAPVEYTVSFENAVHHEAEIKAAFREIGEEALTLRMSRSSPGRYALHEFAKNVYKVSAVNGAGEPLAITRTDPYSWRVENHDGAVTVTYTLYADRADGTYSQIDLTHAHLNMPATFMWAQGFEDRPINLSFQPAQRNWKAATQLPATRRAMTFRAPDLQYFMDSPTQLSNFELRQWSIGEGEERQTIRLAVHHDGESDDVDAFTEKAKKVVAEQINVFGEAPQFDYGVYTFIAAYLPHASRDGMEHRNSTILTRSDGLYESDYAHLGTLSHEFFHAWNVERLRPLELEPFDFFKTNPTPNLWFAEGFTSYYGPLTIKRAGESTLDDYASNLGAMLSNILNAPGRRIASPQEMSLRAPFVDAATSVDPTNRANMFVSYYSYGATIALAMDLSIRERFEGLSLDDYMRHLWRTYGVSETPYTHDDLRNALADVTGDADFAANFFANYIEHGDLPDYEPLLAQAGLKLQRAHADDAFLGRVRFDEDAKGLVLASNTRVGSPLYEVGVDRGDTILRIGRFRTNDKGDFERAVARHEPGDVVTIVFRQRGTERREEITFAENPELEIVLFEDADLELTETHETFRKAWLGEEEETDN
ncbi:Peptidase M61 [Durusdinium trenchii]|uniref:Peptidase M61 n=1 Tax=Durusdinium trenchii TaxID=1381693 RepID=A0ABP0LL15_9DINO